jgi:hypothetical protein
MKKLALIVALFFGFQAHAGFLAEPFLGYESGSTQATTIAGASATSSFSGFDYGARLGYIFGKGFWLAAEYTGASGTDKDSSSSTDYTKTVTSLVFGYDFGKYNIWAGYGFSDKITYKTTSGDLYYSGTNMKIGFGYDLANHVAVNVEYIIPKYTKAGSAAGEVDISTQLSKYDAPSAVLSVSFPFDFSK